MQSRALNSRAGSSSGSPSHSRRLWPLTERRPKSRGALAPHAAAPWSAHSHSGLATWRRRMRREAARAARIRFAQIFGTIPRTRRSCSASSTDSSRRPEGRRPFPLRRFGRTTRFVVTPRSVGVGLSRCRWASRHNHGRAAVAVILVGKAFLRNKRANTSERTRLCGPRRLHAFVEVDLAQDLRRIYLASALLFHLEASTPNCANALENSCKESTDTTSSSPKSSPHSKRWHNLRRRLRGR